MDETTTPPIASRRPTTAVAHGRERSDDYAWLRELDDPETIPHLEAENAWTEASLAHLAGLREQLYEEFRSRIVETDLSVPTRRGPWWYYSRTEEGKSYPIHCRVAASGPDEEPPALSGAPDGEVVLFDENVEAEGHEFFSVGILAVSPDHGCLAVGVDVKGDERLSLSFRRLDGAPSPEESIDDVSYGFAWSTDASTALFTRVDEAWRPHQLWRHRIGDDPAEDVLVLEEPDARFNVSVAAARDHAAIVVGISSNSTTEVLALDAAAPDGELVPVVERVPGVESSVAHLTTAGGQRWWLRLTNQDDALDFALLAARDEGELPSTWQVLLPHRPGIRLEDVEAFSSAVVVSERSDAETRLLVLPVDDDLPAGPYPLDRSFSIGGDLGPATTWIGSNPEHEARWIRYGQTSMTMPSTVAEVELASQQSVLRKVQEVPGYSPDLLVTYRLWAPSTGGERVPVTVVHRADLLVDPRDRSSGLTAPLPTLLYGYGSYEISIDPTFSAFRLSLLDRGGAFAIAHIRGGGELGRRWYDDGHLSAKRHSFDDFIAAADHLAEVGLADGARIVARGGSAGGMLMGAVANRAPERFAGILAEVPFMDSLNTMLDPSLPLTVGEYEEWGNPTDDPEAYATIASWAPYENIEAIPHPPMLLTGGLNDTRVGFWEPAKHVAKLRRLDPSCAVLLRMEMGVGHGGPSGRYDSWREEAYVMAWILERLGLAEVSP